jgi:DNA-binding LacI/PurR family transcriptional regulator
MNRRITSKELARLAGVSSATISRAFTPESKISDATRSHILSLAAQHDYQPNALARSLNNQRSGLVALVVNAVQNPTEAEQLQELIVHLQAMALMPIVLCCGAHEDRLQLMRLASTYQVDHVVVFSDLVTLDDAVSIFRTARPIIVSSQPLDSARAAQIAVEGAAAARAIIDRAVAQGRRAFGYLGGRASSYIDKKRRQWFADALGAHGLGFLAEGHGDYTYDSGYKEAVVMLRQRLDAVICGNDVMAVGFRDAAERLMGRKVPDDLGIVGQDGIQIAGWACHDLTSLALDQKAYVRAILSLIEEQRAGGDQTPRIVIDCHVRWGATL